jgi:hypothetical protein
MELLLGFANDFVAAVALLLLLQDECALGQKLQLQLKRLKMKSYSDKFTDCSTAIL